MNNVIKPLIDAGARHIVLTEAPDVGSAPITKLEGQPKDRSMFTTKVSKRLNVHMKEAATALNSEITTAKIVYFDKFNQVEQVAMKKGLSMSSPCTIGIVGVPYPDESGVPPILPPFNGSYPPNNIWDPKCTLPDAEGFYFWDELHPTDAVHQIFADFIFNELCEIANSTKGPSSNKKSKGKKSSEKTKPKSS